MLESDSPLNRLPSNLHPQQVLLLDGMRTCALIAKDKTLRLHEHLHAISFSDTPPSRHVVFASAWSIVDSAHRFCKFITRFVTETGCPLNEAWVTPMRRVKGLRDTIQHLDERVEQVMVKEQQVLFGQLGWVARGNISDTHGRIFSMTSGYFPFKEQAFNVANPSGRILHNTIDRVTLTAVGRVVNNQFMPVSVVMEEILCSMKQCLMAVERFAKSKMEAMPKAPIMPLDNLMVVRFHGLTDTGCVLTPDVEFKLRR